MFLLEAMPKLGHGHEHSKQRRDSFGMYYHPGSLKAKHCVRGNQLTYEFCAANSVPHRKIGKLVVASSLPGKRILRSNGKWARERSRRPPYFDRDAIRAREPHVEGF